MRPRPTALRSGVSMDSRAVREVSDKLTKRNARAIGMRARESRLLGKQRLRSSGAHRASVHSNAVIRQREERRDGEIALKFPMCRVCLLHVVSISLPTPSETQVRRQTQRVAPHFGGLLRTTGFPVNRDGPLVKTGLRARATMVLPRRDAGSRC